MSIREGLQGGIMSIHEGLKAYIREKDTGRQVRAAVTILNTPIFAARVTSVRTICHIDGTVIPIAIIRPGYDLDGCPSRGPGVGTWRSMVRAEIEGFGK
jgi:hypothetical protein